MTNPQRIARNNPNPQASSTGVAEAVRVRMLGRFSVSVGARTIEEGKWRLRKAAGLVKLLALGPGHRMHRKQLMDVLWPELDEKAQANNLRYALHHARRTKLRINEEKYPATLVRGKAAKYTEYS